MGQALGDGPRGRGIGGRMRSAWRKRGRPRLGRPSTDQGTPELQARRAVLVGGSDPALSEHPLGIMLARGLITPEQHEAGCYYAGLYGRAVGPPDLSVASLYRRLMAESGRGKEIDEADLGRIQALYRLGKNRLLAAGRRISRDREHRGLRPPRAVPGRPADRGAEAGAGCRRARGGPGRTLRPGRLLWPWCRPTRQVRGVKGGEPADAAAGGSGGTVTQEGVTPSYRSRSRSTASAMVR